MLARKRDDGLSEHVISFPVLGLLGLRFLLLLHNLLHLLNGYRTFDVHPFVEDRVAVSQLQHQVDAADVRESHEPETPGLLGPLVLQDDAVLDLAEVPEVLLELGLL